MTLELALIIGGSAALSGDYVWSRGTLDDLYTADPGEFQKHGHLVVEDYADATPWLSQFAPPLTDEQPAPHGADGTLTFHM